ncbi:MAG: hypothetical protein ACK4NS_11475, partial [Saprospiraceae bacterium]
MMKKFTQSFVSLRVALALALPFLAFQTVFAQLNYSAVSCSDPYVNAQGQTGTTYLGAGDDVTYTVALPFNFQLYSTTYIAGTNSLLVSTNGFVVFTPGVARGLVNANLPTATAGAALYPFWDDLDADPAVVPGSGIYTRVDGTMPNRIFTIEWWRIGHFNMAPGTGDITFQVRLFENGNRVQFKYQDVLFDGPHVTFNNGLSATVGLEDVVATPRPSTLVGFNVASVNNGQCIEFVLPQACNPVPVAVGPFNTSPGLCSANVSVPVPNSNPAGCIDGTINGLRYSLNGGPFVNVTLPATSISLSLNKGANVIVWQTFVIANGATSGSATQTINVVDNEPPQILCPSNIVVNLGPGECCRNVSWPEPSATDNCPFITGPFTLNTINSGGNAGAVGGAVYFDINNVSGQPVTITGFGMNISAATNVLVYTKTGTHAGFQNNAGAWTLTATANANTGPFSGPFPGNGTITPATLPVPITLPPGLFGVALVTPTAQQNYTNGNGANQTYTDGNITLNLGSASNTPFGAPFTPRVWNGFVQYQIGGDAEIIQTQGPANGDAFCKEDSPFTIVYEVADAAGNTATCSFRITLNEFPNPVTSLTCNDLVNVSLDASCQYVLGADQVLEGGPYRCYDDYIVEVNRVNNNNGGPWSSPVLGPSDIGKTYKVRVRDPLGGGNMCWGFVKIEDKLPPVLDCPTASLPCNLPTT